MIESSVTSTIDFNTDGKHVGDLRVSWSDNSVPLGYHPVPVGSGSEYPTGTRSCCCVIRWHYVTEPRRPSETIKFAHDGYVLAHTQRGYVARGDLLALVLQDSD